MLRRCKDMNKLCVPRGTIEGFQIREGRGGGSDFGEVKLRGKEPPPLKTLEFWKVYRRKQNPYATKVTHGFT